jgi:hypothetical protein
MILLLATLAFAQDDDWSGPMPSHEVMRPVGLHRDGDAVVPGPPQPCMAKAQVYVPWAICKAIGAPREGDEPLRLEARVQAEPPLPGGTTCALVCTPGAKLANWSYLLPGVGYRGRVTCPVSQRLTQSLVVGPPHAAATAGATVQWQTDLTVTDYSVADESLLDGNIDNLRTLVFDAPRRLDGETRCPAGQPEQAAP